MVFPTFFNLSLNLAIRSSWSEPQSVPGFVFADCVELLHLWLQRYNQSDFGVDRLVISMCRDFSCVVGRGYLLWLVHSLGKTISVCPASFCTLRPNLPVTPGVSSEKVMASHSSTLAWKIPWMEEPGRLQSMGSLRVGHDWATSLSLFTFMHWRRKWQPTPVFLPGESQGQGSLVGCGLWGCTESDTTEAT